MRDICRLFRDSACVGTLLFLLGVLPAWSQTNDLQDQLNADFRGKILLLRNFYSGSDLTYDERGVLVSRAVAGSWTVANIRISGLRVSAQGIEIAGERLGTFYDKGKPRFAKVGKCRIHVARPVSDGEPATEFSSLLLGKVFIPPGEDLRPLVPEYWMYYLSGSDSHSRVSAWEATLEKGKDAPRKPGEAPKGLIPPRAIYSPDPEYTKEASSKNVDGVSVVHTVIDASGAPTHIAIIEPLGMGLDEQSVLALSQWKFRPSTLNGQPVPVEVSIQIDFRCCR